MWPALPRTERVPINWEIEMANVYQRSGRFEVNVLLDADVRKTIRLGQVTRRVAERAAVHIQALADARRQNYQPKADTREWVDALSSTMFDRLVRAGLVDARERRVMPTVKEWIGGYIARRTDACQRSRTTWGATLKSIEKVRGLAEKPIDKVTVGDAHDFKQCMVEAGLATATWSKRIRHARQFFDDAVNRELISRNPFKSIKAPQQVNRDRIQYVDEQAINAVIAACPNTRWKVIVGLVRWAGLRCPSEVFALKWSQVDFEKRLLTVPSLKGSKHGRGIRLVPIDTRLLPLLVRAFDEAAEGAEFVCETPRAGNNANLRTTFEKIIARAGVTPWPRLFHQLRSSRCIDWARSHPMHVVSEWAGHDAAVSAAHYLRVTTTDFEQANGISDEKARQNPRQKDQEMSSTTAKRPTSTFGLSEHFAVLLSAALDLPPGGYTLQGSNLKPSVP